MPRVSDASVRSICGSPRVLLGASAFAIGTGLIAAPAHAAPIIQTHAVAFTNTSAGPLNFSFTINTPISPLAGPANVSIRVVGAIGDGARDGVSLTPTNPGAVQTDLGGGTVASAGGAASLLGAGGTPGAVLLTSTAATFSTPNILSNIATKPIPTLTNRTLSQGAVAGGIVDGGTDGATIAGQNAGGAVAEMRVLNSGVSVDNHFVGVGPYTDAAAFLGSGSDILECTSGNPCNQLGAGLFALISGGDDAAVFLLRHELGGDELTGDVLATYAADNSGSFDCSLIGGCTLVATTLAFTLSGGGDAAAFAIRVEINPEGANVPEPSALSLLLAGLALAAVRRGSRSA